MAQFAPHQGNVRSLLKSKRVEQQALMPAARKLAPLVAANTPKSKRPGGGGTAASTRIEPGHMSVKGDRVAVRVVQTSYSGRKRPRGGAATPLQLGNEITTQRNQFGKALAALHGSR
ncbi:MAG: hypothetical protein INR66_23455 [Gordonia polyisoprenivorans]|nr:hypothetical protein [Gordonia polyisoprenivorans]